MKEFFLKTLLVKDENIWLWPSLKVVIFWDRGSIETKYANSCLAHMTLLKKTMQGMTDNIWECNNSRKPIFKNVSVHQNTYIPCLSNSTAPNSK